MTDLPCRFPYCLKAKQLPAGSLGIFEESSGGFPPLHETRTISATTLSVAITSRFFIRNILALSAGMDMIPVLHHDIGWLGMVARLG
ncbi:hypothetical protein SK1NUM_15830 [Arachnia rubra]|nr:hypothetical protein SK1NUM_15830 [Arachnia rubra]